MCVYICINIYTYMYTHVNILDIQSAVCQINFGSTAA